MLTLLDEEYIIIKSLSGNIQWFDILAQYFVAGLTELPNILNPLCTMCIDETFYKLILKIVSLTNNFDIKYIDPEIWVKLKDDLSAIVNNINVIHDPPDDIIDKLTCEVVVNPMLLCISNSSDVLMDYKTCYNISKLRTNPYTREHISLQNIIDYNAKSDIVERINVITKQITKDHE